MSDTTCDTKTPRVAHSIDDFEVGQRVQWHTETYIRPHTHHHATGVVEREDSGRLVIRYDPDQASYSGRDLGGGQDGIAGNLTNGVWLILEEAPPVEPDPAAAVTAVKSALREALSAYDGHRTPGNPGPFGLRALPDIIDRTRLLLRVLDEAGL